MTQTAPHTVIKGTVQMWMCYDSIRTTPATVWFEILRTGQLHHLYKNGKGRVSLALVNLWEYLQQEYFDEFGVDDSFLIRAQKMKKLTELNLDLIITENRFLLNQINQLELELSKVGEGQVTSYFKVKDAIEKHRKYHIDLSQTMVIEWGHMVRDFEEVGRRAKTEELKQKFRTRGRN